MKHFCFLFLLIPFLFVSCNPAGVPEPEAPEKLVLTGLLENTEYRFREVSWIQKKAFFDKGELVFRYYLSVRAGIDLDKIDMDISTADKTLVLFLPAPRITSIDMEEDSLVLLYEDTLYFNSLNRSEWGHVVETRKEEVRQEALEQGILDLAARRSELFLTGLARQAGYSQVLFQWREGS